MGKVTSCSRGMLLSHAEVGFWRQMTANGGGGNRQTLTAADDGSRVQQGGRVMRCKGEEDTCGYHFHEFPCMHTQALLAMCTLAGIQFPGNYNLGRGGKGWKTQFTTM